MKTKLSVFFSAALVALLAGCAHGPADRSMGGWGHMMGYGGYGGLFMMLILIAVAPVVIYFVWNQNKRNVKLDRQWRF